MICPNQGQNRVSHYTLQSVTFEPLGKNLKWDGKESAEEENGGGVYKAVDQNRGC